MGNRTQRELSFYMMWGLCLSSPSASVGLQHGGFVNRQWPDSKNLHLYLVETYFGCVHKLLKSWGYNFLSLKDICRKILTRNNVFNYDNLLLDCFHGYWSRDFYWPFGEYIYIYIHLNLSQACTLPALLKNRINWTQLKTKHFLFRWHPFFSRPGFVYSILI